MSKSRIENYFLWNHFTFDVLSKSEGSDRPVSEAPLQAEMENPSDKTMWPAFFQMFLYYLSVAVCGSCYAFHLIKTYCFQILQMYPNYANALLNVIKNRFISSQVNYCRLTARSECGTEWSRPDEHSYRSRESLKQAERLVLSRDQLIPAFQSSVMEF